MNTPPLDLNWPPEGLMQCETDYTRYAPVYDLLFDDITADVDFYLRRAAEVGPGGADLLELGSGTGRLTARLLEAGHRVTGLDSNAAMLDVARERLKAFAQRSRLLAGDICQVALAEKFPLIIGPYGVVAHLLTDEARLRCFRAACDHLEEGGRFIFDDFPAWLGPRDDGSKLNVWKSVRDPATGETVRLMTNSIQVADQRFTVRYDIIDRLPDALTVAQRQIVRVVFRNIALADELALLREAGFGEITLRGGFDERPFDAAQPSANSRLIFCCRRGASAAA